MRLSDRALSETEEESLETVDMKLTVHQVLASLSQQVKESAAEVICEALPKVVGDKFQLARLFQNLISNAIKYRSKRPLKIRISAREENAGWVFRVKDNGLGFHPKEIDHIFNMFTRLHGREISGSGIGLAACKKIVELHGGKIGAESQIGKGSTFYFSIPAPVGSSEKLKSL